MNTEELFIIDLDRLEEHWQEQAELMRRFGEATAKARLEYDRLQADLVKLHATLDGEIRRNPETYLPGKPTESAIAKVIESNPEYNKLNDEIIEARYKLERLKALVQALEHRKTALENLVKLHGQQYFALPEVKQIDLRQVDRKILEQRIKAKRSKKQ